MFVDRVEVILNAGRGGDGCVSFRREKYVPKGGPDGGDGGHGGSIVLEAQTGVNSLAPLAGRRFYNAPKGRPGEGSLRHGRRGKDLKLLVPVGTRVIDAADGFVVKDLTAVGESFIAAAGGRGGHGNTRFKTSTNQVPREAHPGGDGESRHVILELQSIADVGLLGKPNVGKSTLLAAISAARPEIADYPFTTKHPNLGIVDCEGDQSFVLADIPGLIEGASDGIGLGHEFLKHVQRAGLLVHLVEPQPVDGTEPVENYRAIREELTQYSTELAGRAEIVVMTKGELDPDGNVLGVLRASLPQHTAAGHVLAISAATGWGLEELKGLVMAQVTARRAELEAAGTPAVPLRETEAPPRPRRRPPHLAGPTADLSNERQPIDVAGEPVTRPR